MYIIFSESAHTIKLSLTKQSTLTIETFLSVCCIKTATRPNCFFLIFTIATNTFFYLVLLITLLSCVCQLYLINEYDDDDDDDDEHDFH